MALENVIAYAVVLGLPLWLVAEEILHRIPPRLVAAALQRRASGSPAPAPVRVTGS
jgi:hypothetical protein